MATGSDIYKRIQKIDIKKVAKDSLMQSKEAALNFQAEQMFSGEKSSGAQIKPAYKPFTVFYKTIHQQVADRVTLKNTGFFYSSLYFVATPEFFEFKSKDPKSEKLMNKYSPLIFGLNKRFRAKLVQEVLKFKAIKNLKKQFGN